VGAQRRTPDILPFGSPIKEAAALMTADQRRVSRVAETLG